MSRQLRALFVFGFLIASVGCFDGAWQTRRMDPEEGLPAELVIRNETRERREFGREIRALLVARRYDSLEHIARRLRQERTRWPNGTWKLRSFYDEAFDGPVVKTSESEWKAFLGQLREWIAARPTSVTAHVALGHAIIEYGWHARGGGYAHEVTEAGHRLLHQRLEQADSVLQAAARLPEFCPATAAARLRVALADHDWSRERYDSLFEAAVAAEPTYEQYYERKAYYLLPRWHGRSGEWQRWAQQVSDHIGGEEGDAMYARIAWLLAEYEGTDMFEDDDVSWERTSRGYQYLTRTYPNSLELQSAYALLATWAEDRSHARAMFERIGPRVEPTVWSSRDGFVQWRDWAMQ